MQDVSRQSHYRDRFPGSIEPIDIMDAVVDDLPADTPRSAVGSIYAGLKYLLRMGQKPSEPVEKELRKACFYLIHAVAIIRGHSHKDARYIAKATTGYLQRLLTKE